MKRCLILGLLAMASAVFASGCAWGVATHFTLEPDEETGELNQPTLHGQWSSDVLDGGVAVWFEYSATTAYGNNAHSSASENPGCLGSGPFATFCSNEGNVGNYLDYQDGADVEPGDHYRLCALGINQSTKVCVGDKTVPDF